MSLPTRPEIKAALDAIDGVKGYVKEPAAYKPGDSWPQTLGATQEAGILEWTWKIYVVLPQDETKAIDWFEGNVEALIFGLQYSELGVGYVDSINTVNLGTPSSPVFGLEINVRS